MALSDIVYGLEGWHDVLSFSFNAMRTIKENVYKDFLYRNVGFHIKYLCLEVLLKWKSIQVRSISMIYETSKQDQCIVKEGYTLFLLIIQN